MFKVYFDAMADDRRPFDEFPSVKAAPVTANHLLPSVLPSGALHIGWPSRVDTAERMVDRFRKVNQMDAYKHKTTFAATDIHKLELEEKRWRNGVPNNVKKLKKRNLNNKTKMRRLNSDRDSESARS